MVKGNQNDLESLDSFDANTRKNALRQLCKDSKLTNAPSRIKPIVNLHSHTFFSYNAYGYSPTHIAYLARRNDWAVAGIVDFDVLDGLDEFTEAGRILGLKTTVGLESRVFVPEFADRIINSPGEPGIAYHMGIGFTESTLLGWAGEYLDAMRRTAGQRNRELVDRVNAFTDPVKLDYDRDVLPLTPNGNATERHICLAYARRAAEIFSGQKRLASFWSDKLKVLSNEFDLPEGQKLQDLVRARTMKRGGVAYVRPGRETFPFLADMNRFVLEAGAIPTITWLDGTSEGERATDELLETAMASGAAALNIIPDRNFIPGMKDQKLRNLYDIVDKARNLDLPLVVGTEMNSPGNKLIDDFDSEELKPLRGDFLKGACIVYAHSVLRSQTGLGYLGEWANEQFAGTAEKNNFFAELGKKLSAGQEANLKQPANNPTPDSILDCFTDA